MQDLRRHRRADHGSFIVDGRGTILGFDEGMETLTLWPAIDVVGHNKDLRLSTSADSRVKSIRTLPLYDGHIPPDSAARSLKMSLNCRDGRRLDVDCSVKSLGGKGQRMLISVLRVVARYATNSIPQGNQSCDSLTGLPDQTSFSAQLENGFRVAAKSARPLALILLDIDHLRKVNDRLGHAAGDEVLKKLAGILRVTVDDERRLARLGDDDFAIMMPNGGRGEARQLAAALRSTVERFRFFPRDERAEDLDVTISLGAASFPADADSQTELYERAREALDEARSMGRNRVWCYLRRPRVPIQVPVFFDGSEPLLVGYTRDISPSGIFVQTTEGIEVGMRCALAFALPGHADKVHVVGRVVRTVLPETDADRDVRIPGLGIEFERFGGNSDRRAIDTFLHGRESTSLRPEDGLLSISD